MDSIREANTYLPAWAIRYVQELVQAAGYTVDIRPSWAERERVGYLIHCQSGAQGIYKLFRDWELCECYDREMLDFWAEKIVKELRGYNNVRK